MVARRPGEEVDMDSDGRDGSAARHWDQLYSQRDPAEVSWFQPSPAVSLELISGLGLHPGDPVLDVGADASTLVDELLSSGHRDVTVLDVSPRALAATRDRLAAADGFSVVVADLLAWTPTRRYRLWHDRAVFHFLTDPAKQAPLPRPRRRRHRRRGWVPDRRDVRRRRAHPLFRAAGRPLHTRPARRGPHAGVRPGRHPSRDPPHPGRGSAAVYLASPHPGPAAPRT